VSISVNGAYVELRLLKDGPKDGWLSDLFVAAALTAAAVSPLQFLFTFTYSDIWH
jgi:hypothetical protein